MIRNIIWDTDGILFDTLPAVTFAICQTLNEMGYAAALNWVDELARKSLDYCVDTLAARFKLDPALLRRRSAEYYRQIPPERQPPFPDALDVCRWIAAHGGLNLIATARSIASTHLLLEAHHISALFGEIFSTEQGYPCKPDPAILVAAVEKYILDPAETLLICRRESDFLAAQAAGIATWQLKQETNMRSIPNDLSTGDYRALLALLNELSQNSTS